MGRRISARALAIFREAVAGSDDQVELLVARLHAACDRLPDPEAPTVREEVMALLEAERKPTSFLRSPPLRIEPSDLIREICAAEAEAAAAQPTFVPLPRRIGQFTLLRRIGTGGAGTVYEARQDAPQRDVALKLLRVAGAPPGAVARFLDEASILSRLRHRGIAVVHAAGIEGLPGDGAGSGTGEQVAYIAMELVAEARTIVRHCAARQLSLRERLHLFLEVCDAVQHAHVHGVIHRDLKPENVLVDAEGSAKVVDFGIARLMDVDPEGPRRTESWQVLGTLGHMAPEHLSSGDCDTRSDIYALGTILYELLCGRPPHELPPKGLGDAVRIVCQEPIVPPARRTRRVPRDLSAVVMQALASEPASRYQSVATLTEDLRRFLTSQPVSARPPGAMRALGLFARRNRALAASMALAAAVAVSALVFAGVHWRRAVLARRESVALRETQDEAVRSLLRQVGPDGERLLAGFLFAALSPEERERFQGVVVCSVPRPDGSPAPLVVADADGTPLMQDDLRVTIPAWVSPRATGELPFTVVDACVEEVDPANPGREILVMLRPQGGTREQRELSLLRIYDLGLRPIREAWTSGWFTSLIWNSQARLLVVTIDAIWLQYFLPELAAFDAAHCHDNTPTATAIVALPPEAVQGVVLPPDGPYTTACPESVPLAPIRWALCRVPLELRDPTEGGRMGSIGIEPPDNAGRGAAACTVVEATRGDGRTGSGGRGRSQTSRRVTLDVDGGLRAGADFDFFRERLRPLDLRAMALGKPVADSALSTLGDPDRAHRALLADSNLDPAARRGALHRLATIRVNWRWLNLLADQALMEQSEWVNPLDRQKTLELARMACALHDARCPDLARCRVRWYVRDTLGLALFRNGHFSEALDALLECEARWKTLAGGLQPNAAGEVAVQAMCLYRLGRHEEAREALARAQRELPTSEAHNGASAALVAEAQALLSDQRGNGDPPAPKSDPLPKSDGSAAPPGST